MNSGAYGSAIYPAIWTLPVELLTEVAQYIVQVDNLSDYLHFSQTCRCLYATLWLDTAEMWRHIFRTLYDPAAFENTDTAIQMDGIPVWNPSNESNGSHYKLALKGRLQALQELRQIGNRLDEDIVPWKTLPGYGTQRGLEPNTVQCVGVTACGRVPSEMQVAHALWMLARIGAEHVDKNLLWIREVATPKLWAYATYLWFNQKRFQQHIVAGQSFYKLETISELYETLAKIAVIDTCVLSALYRNEYESFRYIRGVLLRHESRTIHSLLKLNRGGITPRLCFPWSMCHVFYMVLFYGPSILAKEVLISPPKMISRQATVDSHELEVILQRAVPTWFNLGSNPENIAPIPLTIPKKTIRLTQQQQPKAGQGMNSLMGGEWTGYYAYSVLVSHNQSDVETDSDGDDDELRTPGVERLIPDLEYAARGLRVDKKMTFRLVDWTNESLKNEGESDRNPLMSDLGEADMPLYLSSEKDADVVNILDEYFRRPSTSDEGNIEIEGAGLDVDDLSDRTHWGYQRIFSGRGHDAIGEFGMRGFVSERSGLVRIVKSYFNPDFQMRVKNRMFFEFGDQPHQLQSDLQGNSVVWYYRGRMGPEGILGLWYDDDVSGPFWMYRVDCLTTRLEK
ncbi:hypothetical protein BGZ80_005254 [Entomortierella chlamydospora]|uniref:F-box domain-containing protein n=1 Tax=Entomortierella chlamydospora TaxID=101097 RepID=A0A9P6N0Y1_9FUNG|nr:hypothetical protein BGZ80_005254 [Entomortierella chlamydospora]